MTRPTPRRARRPVPPVLPLRPRRAADALDLCAVLDDALSVPMARFGGRVVECALEVELDLMVQTEPIVWNEVLTTLVANSVLHGFAGRAGGGSISVSAGRLGADRVRVTYRDDGAGSSGVGLRAVRDIVRDRLHGTLAVLDCEHGAALTIDFPTRRLRAC